MSVLQQLNNIKDTVPHYWPIGSFIHHNPLKGFEHLPFEEALQKAQSIYGGKVYMDASYYRELYDNGKIDPQILSANITHFLKKHHLAIDAEFAKRFMLEVSAKWDRLRIQFLYKNEKIDYALYLHLQSKSIYYNEKKWLQQLTKDMTLCEINDALFGHTDHDRVQKSIVEFISRFLDEDQTTIGMPNRELGMFEAFKHYKNFAYEKDAQSYVEEVLEELKVENTESYLLTHLLKLHGWAGFIKYRSEDPDYAPQQKYPSSLIDFIAIRLYHEVQTAKKRKIKNFQELEAYFEENLSESILQVLKQKNLLFGPALDTLEAGGSTNSILCSHISNEINLDALQIQHARNVLESDLPLIELAEMIGKLKKDEGYIWLKSLEDSYIRQYTEQFTTPQPEVEEQPLATATFCLDVRSEVVRRFIEQSGPYKTFGAGGFLGIPIAFVEFDKAHERFLSPAIVKPQNVIFEIPSESSQEYKAKKGVTKTTKKVLSDLKNNPYTPFITVEAIGWIFGINLFGKTFMPRKVEKLFSKIKPKKPKTTYTIDQLSAHEIEFYIQKLHTKIISKFLMSRLDKAFSKAELEIIWRHLVFNEPLVLDIPGDAIEKLRSEYQITPEDYAYQKNKLSMVGFTLAEKVAYLKKYLTTIGQVKDFPEFVTIIGHGSCSDNNPFESALDCGACGGNVSLPNTRALCMIANSKEVREKLRAEGIDIPENTKFIPGLHTTTTDEIKFYDTDHLTPFEKEKFSRVEEDFNTASKMSREERSHALPYTKTHEDIMIKSMDWSEPRPEWGLAKNMGVFAGPRNSIKHLSLQNRFFMHSYDWKIDNDEADILTRIFDGPLIVGEWINLEHYFSTVDNYVYGAGSKVYHNIVGKVGVYSGNYSDLKIGLPTQSVYLEGKPYHEPVRLLTFMEAPLEKVLKAVERSIAKPFILNEWIRPVVIDKEAGKVYVYENGDFTVIKTL